MKGWSAVLYRDGEPVSGVVPVDVWDVASIMGPVVVGWVGGPVSVARAVHATRLAPPVQGSLLDEEAK